MYIHKIFQIKKLPLFLAVLLFCIVTLTLLSNSKAPYTTKDEKERILKLKNIDNLIKTKSNTAACRQPNLPVYSPEIMKFVHSVPKIDCFKSGEDWVKCQGSECNVQEDVIIKYGPIKCSFTDLIRLNDFNSSEGKTTVASKYKLRASDVVRVACMSSGKNWSSTLMGVRFDKDIWEHSQWTNFPESALKMDILMFGFDSLSRNTFIRKLPKSYEYLVKELKADVLEGYNIVGDGTPQALIPILTGQTELELPDTRKRIKKSQYVNVYPFIWNEYKKANYVTAFFEDVPELSTFTYRLNGFKEAPTDHYMRPYYLASLGERNKWPKLCTGEIPRHKIMFNAIKNFFMVYKTKPKFLFGFHGELSHDDYNLIGVADDDFLEFLKDLNETEVLQNTILIIMADHGHRFAEIRNTIQGKQEERLPFFSFRFPDWFKEKYSIAYENFQSNLDKLVTPFDIHNTLKSALDLKDMGIADIKQRSVSLFTKIPPERSCAHAYIEPHWCACLDWSEIRISNSIVPKLADTLINTLNNYTEKYRYLCHPLSLADIHWTMKMTPNENLLKFHKNADFDGFVANMSAKMELQSDMYQIKVLCKPGDSLFEASILHNLNNDTLQLKLGDISRINLYGKQARCVENDLPELRKYCYCRDHFQ